MTDAEVGAKTILQRIDEKVIVESGCMIWTGARNGNGYGQLWINNKSQLVHVYLWEVANGPKPRGLELDHLCCNPGCVNPEHLELVTHRENMLRGKTNACGNHARKTNCDKGHEFTKENTIVRKNGGRECRTCRRAQNAAYYRSRHIDPATWKGGE